MFHSCPIKELVEDCVCNVGFIRDGERCVRQSDCGTTENGVYRSKVISVDRKHNKYEFPVLIQVYIGLVVAFVLRYIIENSVRPAVKSYCLRHAAKYLP